MNRKIGWKDILIVVLDIIAVNAGYLLALYARFYGFTVVGKLFYSYLSAFWHFAPFYTIICIIVFHFFGLYKGTWKYAGLNDLNRVIVASAVTCVVQVLGTIIFVKRMPLTYYIVGTMFQFFFVGAVRMGYRIFLMEKAKLM